MPANRPLTGSNYTWVLYVPPKPKNIYRMATGQVYPVPLPHARWNVLQFPSPMWAKILIISLCVRITLLKAGSPCIYICWRGNTHWHCWEFGFWLWNLFSHISIKNSLQLIMPELHSCLFPAARSAKGVLAQLSSEVNLIPHYFCWTEIADYLKHSTVHL